MVKLFVYGTLRKSERREHLLKKYLFLGYARAKGYLLYDLGKYPGIVEGDGEVVGEVYEISEKKLKELDWIEGVPDLFRRELIEVVLENGETISAYTYIYNGDVEEGELIPSGDWKLRRKESIEEVKERLLQELLRLSDEEEAHSEELMVELKEYLKKRGLAS
jgi:gamma-glutamylcyclotransferase (GGCT)/AIG2-like uncharacterized protein YtfP